MNNLCYNYVVMMRNNIVPMILRKKGGFMSENEELKNEKKECGCEKRALVKFLLLVFASFIGTLIALCLYGASIKPQPPVPVMPPRFEAQAPQQNHPSGCNCKKHANVKQDVRPDRPDVKPPVKHPENIDRK